MSIIKVKTKSEYNILIENGSLNALGKTAACFCGGKRACVVSDSNVAPLYGASAISSLKSSGFDASLVTIPAGEENKRLVTVEYLYSAFNKNQITRLDIIIALGGGVTGDITGFAAGTYLRGVPYIQVPTTLLAQIDSSVGGKTGVDLEEGKNLAGIFNQPKAVIIDPTLLKTLSPKIFCDGMAEAIKYGCIKDKKLYDFIGTHDLVDDNLLYMIESCVKIKRDVVEADEFDKGDRMLLNFGHTIGHAVEKCGGYTKYSHGEAVAIGMVKACEIGEHIFITKKGTADKLRRLLLKFKLPVSYEENNKDIINALLSDKKRLSNDINFILLEAIGKSVIMKMPIEKIKGLL